MEPDPKGEFGSQLKDFYPVGSKVKVYYNSESPNRACLVPGLPVPDGKKKLVEKSSLRFHKFLFLFLFFSFLVCWVFFF